MRSVWTGSLVFGKVTMPIRLGVAVSRGWDRSPFRLLHATCGTPIEQLRRCPGCNVDLGEGAELARGVEVTPGRFVVVDDAELDAALDTETIVLERFVPLSDVPELLVDKSYWIAPVADRLGEAERTYATFLAAIADRRIGGLCRIAWRQSEYLAIVKPLEGILGLQTLYLGEHVRDADRREILARVSKVAVAPDEVELFRDVVERRTKVRFSPNRIGQAFPARLPALVAEKIAAGVPTVGDSSGAAADGLGEQLRLSVRGRRPAASKS